MNQSEKAQAFRALHEGEPFVIPNPPDAGTARLLEALGFKAVATTSSGFAFTLGRLDGGATLDEKAAHIALVASATGLPLSADLENGYGPAPADAEQAILRAAAAGAVGGSIEDYDPDSDRIYELSQAAERIAAARAAADTLDFPFTLTGRAENLLHGNPDLDDTIARLQAYERAGADVLFAPGLRSAEQVRAVCGAVSKPVNVLVHPKLPPGEAADAGAQRMSVGGALTWVAVAAFRDAAEALARGDVSPLATRVALKDWLG
jgi:2-methylisocitrate lyase-like PEP mutase family enzyme